MLSLVKFSIVVDNYTTGAANRAGIGALEGSGTECVGRWYSLLVCQEKRLAVPAKENHKSRDGRKSVQSSHSEPLIPL